MSSAYYLAYYELHEVPWKLEDNIIFQDNDSRMHFQLGRGPYLIPEIARPTVSTVAGGARIELINDTFVLKGGTYFGVAVPVEVELVASNNISSLDWSSYSKKADSAARVAGLCLNQRLSLKKIAHYLRVDGKGEKVEKMLALVEARAGDKAVVNRRSIASIGRALGHIMDSTSSSQLQVALRWYEESKAVTHGSDRLLALWIALEALFPSRGDLKKVAAKTAFELSHKVYKLHLNSDQIRSVLGLDRMREIRNRIVHEGYSPVPWPVAHSSDERDWPQILNDIVGEILRRRLGATLTRSLNKHIMDVDGKASFTPELNPSI